MPDNSRTNLDSIFKPKSIVFIGASNNPAKWGGRVIRSTLYSSFPGTIYPVNPGVAEIMGMKSYADVRDIPGDIDLAVFTVPAAEMPGVMQSCVEKRIKGGVVISADFAETGEAGKALEDEIVRIARNGGLRFVGPNGNGIFSAATRLNITPFRPRRGNLAFVSQSGMFSGNAVRIASEKQIGFSKIIAMGNQADLTVTDYLEYLARDDDTRIILLYIEGLKDGRRFFKVAHRVALEKPILLLKGGSSTVGARAAMSHTASIAGDDNVFDGMCRQAGLIRAYQLEDLFFMADALLGQPLPKGNRMAILCDGGQGVITADNLCHHRMTLPEFDEMDKQAIKAILPPHAPVPRNPIDYAGSPIPIADEVNLIKMLAKISYIDGIITNVPMEWTVYAKSLADRNRQIIDAVEKFCEIPKETGVPIITQNLMASSLTLDLLRQGKVPVCNTPRECSLAMLGLVTYAAFKKGGTE